MKNTTNRNLIQSTTIMENIHSFPVIREESRLNTRTVSVHIVRFLYGGFIKSELRMLGKINSDDNCWFTTTLRRRKNLLGSGLLL
jgi:hypothetical protein